MIVIPYAVLLFIWREGNRRVFEDVEMSRECVKLKWMAPSFVIMRVFHANVLILLILVGSPHFGCI